LTYISSRWPWQGWLGIVLIAVFWSVNWGMTGLRTHWVFFPLWLGYCLLVDACVAYRKGHSLLTRNSLAFAGLFVISAPTWWLFEMINRITQYWIYSDRDAFSDLEYYFWASVYVDIPIVTGMGSARNNINVLTSDFIVACGMGAGTLSEVSLGLKAAKPVILLGWDRDGIAFLYKLDPENVHVAESIDEAISLINSHLK